MQLETQRPVSIIVVTYNSASVLRPLLDSIAEGLAGVYAYTVVIVDNNSHDGSAELAEAHLVGPTIVRMGRNAGYAAAINAGMAVIDRHSDVLILNPDLRLYPNAVKPLMELTAHPAVGVAVPRNFKEDLTTDPTLRREPSIVTAWAEAVLGGKLAARIGLGEIVGDLALYDVRQRIKWATGSALLVSARARAVVGDWDESYFLYSEEVDYQRKVREAGFDIVYEPRSEVMHAGGESGVNPRLFALLTANRIRYYRRNHGAAATWLFRLGIVVGEALRYRRGSVHQAALRSAIHPVQCARDFLAKQPG